MKAVVVGLGQFGSSAAIALARAGAETIAMDVDMAPVDAIKDQVDYAVCTDASAKGALGKHGGDAADVLLAAIGEDFEAQILVVVEAKRIGIGRVVARANTEVHRRVLEAIGADVVVNPEHEAAQETVLRLIAPGESINVQIVEGLAVFETKATGGMTGRTLRDQGDDLFHRRGIRLVAVRRVTENGEATVHLDPDARIEEGDSLFLAGGDKAALAMLGES